MTLVRARLRIHEVNHSILLLEEEPLGGLLLYEEEITDITYCAVIDADPALTGLVVGSQPQIIDTINAICPCQMEVVSSHEGAMDIDGGPSLSGEAGGGHC